MNLFCEPTVGLFLEDSPHKEAVTWTRRAEARACLTVLGATQAIVRVCAECPGVLRESIVASLKSSLDSLDCNLDSSG